MTTKSAVRAVLVGLGIGALVVGAFIIGRIARTVLFLEIPDYKQQLPLAYNGIAISVSTTGGWVMAQAVRRATAPETRQVWRIITLPPRWRHGQAGRTFRRPEDKSITP